MTHSLHRRGSRESLRGDYVMVCRTSKVNKAVTGPVLSRIAEIIFEVGVSNTGSSYLETNIPLGLDREMFKARIAEAHGLLCSFSSKEKLEQVLARIHEEKLGISITVSGLIDEVVPLAQSMGIKPHTINLSMGILGKKEKLADEELLEYTTMCGHALIATNLVKKGIADVASGKKSPREASMMIGAPCICGIFNLDRSELMLQKPASR
jgi:hypothetical protein